MNFARALKEVVWCLVTEGSISYRRIQRGLGLSDDALEDLRRELIDTLRLASDLDSELLVWAPEGSASQSVTALQPRQPLPSLRRLPVVVAATTSASAEPVFAPRELPGAQRRQLTVMFCDLADSTHLSVQLDPEDMGDVIRAYQVLISEAVRRFDGFIAKFMGDGVLVYYGYPHAHGNDAERAVHSALAIVEAMPALNQDVGHGDGVQLAVRIGIASGLVVVGETIGEGTAREQTVVGETPNLAARLQALAGPNAILLSGATHDIVGDGFVYEELGAHAVKGIAEPVQAWRVVGPRDEEHDVDIDAHGDFPLVGRDEEIGLLRRAWQQTKEEGHGQVVFICGEPGIGKTSLVDTLRRAARSEGLPRITFRCAPYHTNSALHPIIEHFRRLFGWQPEDDGLTRFDKLERVLSGYETHKGELVPLFAALMSVPLLENNRHELLDLSPEQLKERTEDALVALALEEAERQPLLEVWEDVHWADASTLDVLGQLIDQVPTLPLLIVLTYRPEFVPRWPTRSHVMPLTLNRLERPQIELLANRLAGDKALPPEVIEHVVQKTDGVPLFVEEMTKAVLGSNVLRPDGDRYALTGPLSEISIPASLHESLMARLDRLPTVREVAQLGAVLGREFAYDMLQAIAAIDEPRLRDGLGRLVEAELLYQRGRPPRARYVFKHALIQDAAYQSLLRRTRQQYHRQVAELLESEFSDTVETSPELVAHHFSEAGLPEQAIVYWQRAGERAMRRSGNQEAVGHLSAGLTQLVQLPDTAERVRQELALQRLLGQASFATKGHVSPEAINAFNRARELCKAIGDDATILPVLAGVYLFELTGGRHQNALSTAEEVFRRAEITTDNGIHLMAYCNRAVSLLHLGALPSAHADFEQTARISASLNDDEAARLSYDFGVNYRAAARAYGSWCWWLLGYPDQALQMSKEGLADVNRVQHDYSRIRALYWNSAFHALRRDWPAVDECACAAITAAQERGLAMVAAAGRIMRGTARAMMQPGGELVGEIREGLDSYRSTGARFQNTQHLTLLAEAEAASGRHDEALAALREAMQVAKETGERYVEAEIQRLQGDLVLARSANATAKAEACYRQALKIARTQEARSLELRAATGLARLWAEQGERQKAADLLGPVHGWFCEGFDTTDLTNAKELLKQLS